MNDRNRTLKPFVPQPDDDIKLPAGGHQHLNAVQVCAVLLQKPAYGRELLAGLPFLIEGLVPFKGLLGVERQHLDLGLSLDHIQQSVDSGADAGVRQDADVRSEEHTYELQSHLGISRTPSSA